MSKAVKTYDISKEDSAVYLTTAAVEHIQRYISQHQEGQHLRISIKTAGCNGLQYVYDIVTEGKEQDLVFSQQGFNLYVAEDSIAFIRGSTFDYVEDGIQRGWKVTNPQEKGSCGCGESFTT